jgi:hypothetical protein
MANETAQPAPVPEGTAELGAAQRLGGVFFSPGATFRSIARKPGFWPPVIAFIVVNLAGWAVMIYKVGAAQIASVQLAISGRAAMTHQQSEAALRALEKFWTYGPLFGAVVGPFIVFLILALLGLAILKAIFGQQLKFKTAYSVVAYAFMPNLLAVLLGMATAAFGDPSAFNATNPAPTNLGFFLSPQSVSHALYTGATSLDILSFWTMVLLGIGFSEAVGRKVSSKGVFLSFFVLWVLLVLIKMGLALI